MGETGQGNQNEDPGCAYMREGEVLHLPRQALSEELDDARA